jgi:transcriptional regulator with XRE-family HTH domain
MTVNDDTILRGTKTHWPSVLRHHRFTHNLKQAALAHDLGVTQAMISRWESGRATPSGVMQTRLKGLFDEAAIGVPMPNWREITALQPAMATIISRAGLVETVSQGVLRECRMDRSDIEGHKLSAFMSGDAVSLHQALLDQGFFDGAVEMAESADLMNFRLANGMKRDFYAHRLHWPRRDVDGDIRWASDGARISKDEFDAMRDELGGQLDVILAV